MSKDGFGCRSLGAGNLLSALQYTGWTPSISQICPEAQAQEFGISE